MSPKQTTAAGERLPTCWRNSRRPGSRSASSRPLPPRARRPGPTSSPRGPVRGRGLRPRRLGVAQPHPTRRLPGPQDARGLRLHRPIGRREAADLPPDQRRLGPGIRLVRSARSVRPPLGLGRADRRLDHVDAFGAEDLVKPATKSGVAVADQERARPTGRACGARRRSADSPQRGFSRARRTTSSRVLASIGRAPWPRWGIGPPAPHEPAVRAQQRVRRDEQPLAACGRQQPGCRREAALPADQDRRRPRHDHPRRAATGAQPHPVIPCPAQVTAIPSMPLDPSKAGSPCTVAIRVSVPSDATA